MKRSICALFVFLASLFAHAQVPYPNPIRHVIFVIQENRTPDNLFQGLLTWPGLNPAHYDIATSGLNSKGHTIQLHPIPLGIAYDMSHAHSAFVQMYDGGKMDGANKISCGGTCPANPQYGYVENTKGDLDPYLTLAADYGWANDMFQTNQGPSYPAHQFLFGGTSAPSAFDDFLGIYLAENTVSPSGASYSGFSDSGCLAPLGEMVFYIDSTGKETKITNSVLGTFCYNRTTMADLLNRFGLSWKYYAQAQNNPNKTNPGGSIWNAPNSITSICQPNSSYTSCTGRQWKSNVDLTPANVLTDIANCQLPNVSWVTPLGRNSDHPGSTATTGGPSWVASIVNAVGNATNCDFSGYWNDTAIIVTWDDWGGWYDHVAPPILNGNYGAYQLGFRVPLLVISAYTPPAFVSNQNHDFGSVLRFAQGIFGMREGSLGFADARSSDDLSDFFNFRSRPRPFVNIPAPLNAAYFINDKAPSEPPDND